MQQKHVLWLKQNSNPAKSSMFNSASVAYPETFLPHFNSLISVRESIKRSLVLYADRAELAISLQGIYNRACIIVLRPQ